MIGKLFLGVLAGAALAFFRCNTPGGKTDA